MNLFKHSVKGLFATFAVAAAAILAPNATHAAIPAAGVNVQVNHELVRFPDARPFIDDQRLQVPARFVSEELGLDVDWYSNDNGIQVTLSNGLHKVLLSTGQDQALVDGNPANLESEAQIHHGRMYVPLSFLANALDIPVRWDKSFKTAVLSKDGNHYPTVKEMKTAATFTATAYSSAASENGGYGAVDYFGNPLQVGTVAVDPSVIPLGSKLYIEGYNFMGLPVGGMWAKATDIGGAIKGNRIDIFVPGSPSKVQQFGIQKVKVYRVS